MRLFMQGRFHLITARGIRAGAVDLTCMVQLHGLCMGDGIDTLTASVTTECYRTRPLHHLLNVSPRTDQGHERIERETAVDVFLAVLHQ